jgi:hypothetical protein
MVFRAAVYDPPEDGLPFLGAVIFEDGSVQAKGFETAKEAQAFVDQAAEGLAASVAKGNF